MASSLTRFPCPASDRLAPWSKPDAIAALDPNFILRPLLQVFNGKFPLQTVIDDVGQTTALWADAVVLDPVAHLFCDPIVFPFRQRLRCINMKNKSDSVF